MASTTTGTHPEDEELDLIIIGGVWSQERLYSGLKKG
jgi:hypothetical protein